MKTIGLVLDNVAILYENKLIFNALDEFYKEDKNISINIFCKTLSWPYRPIDYGIFKLVDYQNYEGRTIVTNLELLDYCLNVPNNNKICLYLDNFPFHKNISGKIAINLLTLSNLNVYCSNEDIQKFIASFGRSTKVCTFYEAIRENLYV